ncbi:hypothetical protein SAMN05443431_108118 [Olleya namhaensis]|uniref:Uncharacterized protein n=1 Tax=Olleya namhaensis TaxID=1144750 RepID=A0A1I3RR48_9FLAO|nr:hypothetical protein SAMN05443431_108118 [Olleya namhaensis]
MKLKNHIYLGIGILLTDFIFIFIALFILEGYKYSHNVNTIKYFHFTSMTIKEKLAYSSIYAIIALNVALIIYVILKNNKK